MSTTLAVIGDIHGQLSILDKVLAHVETVAVDGVLLVGDIAIGAGFARHRRPEIDARHRASMAEVLNRVRALGAPVRYVPGNHDAPDQVEPGNIDGRVETIGGLRVFGLGGSPKAFGFPYEWEEDAILALEQPAADILLCHCPPFETRLDLLSDGMSHVGSEAIRRLAERHTGFLVCGHIHESVDAEQLGDCLCVNVGGLGHPFGMAQVGFIRRSQALAGAIAQDEAWHINLETGAERRWRRT